MKAYPFYSISGNEIAWINFTYRFPLWRNIDYKLSFLYFDKIFLSFHLITEMHGQVILHHFLISKRVLVQKYGLT